MEIQRKSRSRKPSKWCGNWWRLPAASNGDRALIELRRWSAPPGISGLVAIAGALLEGSRGESRWVGADLLMEQARQWRGYPALSRPLTIMGVERRWFL